MLKDCFLYFVNFIMMLVTSALIPIVCIWHYIRLVYAAYCEYCFYFTFHPRYFRSIFTDLSVMIKPQTMWLVKECSFYHQDKPELLEAVVIEAFRSFIEDENGLEDGSEEVLKEFRAILEALKNYDMQKLERFKNHKEMEKFDSMQTKLANRIWSIRRYLWS